MSSHGGSPDPKSRLGSFLSTTLRRLDTARDLVLRGGRAGRIQLELTLLRRRRRDVLITVGETAARLAAEGRLEVIDFPELQEPFRRLEDLDERIAVEERRARAVAAGLPEDDELDFAGWGDEDQEAGADDEAGADASGGPATAASAAEAGTTTEGAQAGATEAGSAGAAVDAEDEGEVNGAGVGDEGEGEVGAAGADDGGAERGGEVGEEEEQEQVGPEAETEAEAEAAAEAETKAVAGAVAEAVAEAVADAEADADAALEAGVAAETRGGKSPRRRGHRRRR